jgi:hypothetical protein
MARMELEGVALPARIVQDLQGERFSVSTRASKVVVSFPPTGDPASFRDKLERLASDWTRDGAVRRARVQRGATWRGDYA